MVLLSGPLGAQPAPPPTDPSPYAPQRDDSIFERSDVDTEADAAAAMARAKRAREQAQCLRRGSAAVDGAARRLRWAHGRAAIDKSKVALSDALAKLDRCWDQAFDTEAGPGGQRSTKAPAATPPKRAHFGFGEVRVEEGPIDGHTLARPLRDHAARYRHCYASALRSNPQLRGRLYFRITLERRAHHTIPASVAVPSASLTDPAVQRCLADALRNTAFPAYADTSTFTFMMDFASVDE